MSGILSNQARRNFLALAAAGGAGTVGSQPMGVGALASTVKDDLSTLSVHVKNHGALTGGFADATAAINAAILAAQKLKCNQLSYDEIYSVTVRFESGQDYKVVGPILLPSGVVLDMRGSRLIGNVAGAGAANYDDALLSIIESAYYDGTVIVSNRTAGLNTKRLVGAGVKNATFLNANCAINLVQANELSFVKNCRMSNVSVAMRLKNCYYLDVDKISITGSAMALNQSAVLLYGGNHNNMRLHKIRCGAGASVGISISGGASAGSSISYCTFEESTGTGIYFAADAYCSGWAIGPINYFEGVRYGIVAADGAGVYGAAIDNNTFSNCEYAILSAPGALRLASFRGNALPDGGGVIRNLVDLSATGNDIRYQIPGKSASSATGPAAFLSNVIPSNVSIAETTSTWTDTAEPYPAIAKSLPGLANQGELNEFAFEGGQIVSTSNQVPFVTRIVGVNTLTFDTQIKYDLANVLVFNFFGETDSIAYTLHGFIFGVTEYWVTRNPADVTIAVTNNGGYVRLVFGNLTAAIPVINTSGMVRHV